MCVLSDAQTKRLVDAMRCLSTALIRHIRHKEQTKNYRTKQETQKKRRNKAQKGEAKHGPMLSGQLFSVKSGLFYSLRAG